MSSPISFPDTTPQFSLPLLFSGQAQKEFSINQAFSVIDAMMRGTVTGPLATPPANPEEGDCYLILVGATGDWTGRDHDIAVHVGGGWHFISPSEGMRIHDLSGGMAIYRDSKWEYAEEPVSPDGGTTIDAEARLALSQLIESLRQVGILTSGN